MITYATFGFVTLIYVTYALFKVIVRIKDSFKIDLNRKRIVFVTSCDDTDGRKLVQVLDEMGFTVFAGCCTKIAAEKIKQTSTDKVLPVVYDATKLTSIDDAVAYIAKNLPGDAGIWALIANHRFCGEPSMFEWTSDAETEHVVRLNLLNTAHWCRKLLPWIRRERGRVVMTTSYPAKGVPTWVEYDVAVAGIEALYLSLRQQLCKVPISFHCVKLPYVNPRNSGKEQQVLMERFNNMAPAIQGYYGNKIVNFIVNQSMNQSRNIIDETTRLYAGAVSHMFPQSVYTVEIGWQDWLLLQVLPRCINQAIQTQKMPAPEGIKGSKARQ